MSKNLWSDGPNNQVRSLAVVQLLKHYFEDHTDKKKLVKIYHEYSCNLKVNYARDT